MISFNKTESSVPSINDIPKKVLLNKIISNNYTYIPQTDLTALSEYCQKLKYLSPKMSCQIFDEEDFYTIYIPDELYKSFQSEINAIAKKILDKYFDVYSKNIICCSKDEIIEELSEKEIYIPEINIQFTSQDIHYVLNIFNNPRGCGEFKRSLNQSSAA